MWWDHAAPLLLALQDAGVGDSIDIPIEALLGPLGLTAYLLYRDWRREKKIDELEDKIDTLNAESKDMAKAALAALKKFGESP